MKNRTTLALLLVALQFTAFKIARADTTQTFTSACSVTQPAAVNSLNAQSATFISDCTDFGGTITPGAFVNGTCDQNGAALAACIERAESSPRGPSPTGCFTAFPYLAGFSVTQTLTCVGVTVGPKPSSTGVSK